MLQSRQAVPNKPKPLEFFEFASTCPNHKRWSEGELPSPPSIVVLPDRADPGEMRDLPPAPLGDSVDSDEDTRATVIEALEFASMLDKRSMKRACETGVAPCLAVVECLKAKLSGVPVERRQKL
jgi:hypothetical protein